MDIQKLRMAVLHKAIASMSDTGKTRLQKICYFMQESFGLPTSYSFRMHHYGPYADALDTDITRLKFSGYIDVKVDLEGYGYHITAIDEPEEEWNPLLDPYIGLIEEGISKLRDWQTSELELAATIHFVERLLPSADDEVVLAKVKELKPRFDKSKIVSLHSKLFEMDLLSGRIPS